MNWLQRQSPGLRTTRRVAADTAYPQRVADLRCHLALRQTRQTAPRQPTCGCESCQTRNHGDPCREKAKIALQARFIRTCCNLDSLASNTIKNRALHSLAVPSISWTPSL